MERSARPGLKRGARLLLLAGLAVLAWQALAFGLAMRLRGIDPALAARIAPGNALVQSALARSRLSTDVRAAEAAGRRSLERDPTQAAAAGALGLALVQSGQLAEARSALAYAQRLSRRDLEVQYWAIEAAVERGDVAEALRHYDIALRVGPRTPEVLFPVLAVAIADPLIRDPLADLMASGVAWQGSFLDYLSSQARDVVPAGQLAVAILERKGALSSGQANTLMVRLAEAGEFDEAWALYQRLNPGARRDGVRNGAFEASVEAPSLFDWQLHDLGDARAEIVPGDKGDALYVEARSDAGGSVAQQRLLLPPGRYTLSMKAADAQDATLSRSAARVLCLPSTQRIAELPLAEANGKRIAFTVGGQCRSQLLEIDLYSGGMDRAIGGTIDDITIQPAAGGRGE